MVASNSTQWPSNQPIGAAIGQYAIGEGPTGGGPNVPPDGFLGQGWSLPVRLPKGLKVYLQQFYANDTVPIPLSQGMGWFNPISEPRRFPPIREAALYPYQAYGQAATQNAPNNNFAEEAYYSKYAFAWSDPVRVKGQPIPGLHASLQQAWTSDPIILPTQNVFLQHSWLAEPVRQKRGLSPTLQQVLAFQPNPVVSWDWRQWLSEPQRQKVGLREYLQQTTAIDTIPLPTSRGFGWLKPFDEPKRFLQGMSPELQQWYQQDVPPPPDPSKIMGYYRQLDGPIYPPLFLAHYQRFFTDPTRLIPPPDVTVTLGATETNEDVALIGVEVYDSVTSTTSSQIANVSIVEVPAISGGFGAIQGD